MPGSLAMLSPSSNGQAWGRWGGQGEKLQCSTLAQHRVRPFLGLRLSVKGSTFDRSPGRTDLSVWKTGGLVR